MLALIEVTSERAPSKSPSTIFSDMFLRTLCALANAAKTPLPTVTERSMQRTSQNSPASHLRPDRRELVYLLVFIRVSIENPNKRQKKLAFWYSARSASLQIKMRTASAMITTSSAAPLKIDMNGESAVILSPLSFPSDLARSPSFRPGSPCYRDSF